MSVVTCCEFIDGPIHGTCKDIKHPLPRRIRIPLPPDETSGVDQRGRPAFRSTIYCYEGGGTYVWEKDRGGG